MISLFYYFAVGTLAFGGMALIGLCLAWGIGWIVLRVLSGQYGLDETIYCGIVTLLLLMLVVLMVGLGAALTGNV